MEVADERLFTDVDADEAPQIVPERQKNVIPVTFTGDNSEHAVPQVTNGKKYHKRKCAAPELFLLELCC